MARQKGSSTFAGTLEILAGGPIDARAQVPTKADLLVAANFPYPYVGMQTYVLAENKRYKLIGADVTVEANWEEEGGGGSGGGHTIEDPEGTELTQRDTLQFGGDLEVSDDDENEKTVVSPHELTTAELAEIVTPLPSVPVNMPILFDESGAEYQVGWYKYANGTKKPVYEKTIVIDSLQNNAWNEQAHGIADIDAVINAFGGLVKLDSGFYSAGGYKSGAIGLYADHTVIEVWINSSLASSDKVLITLQYTKTTDTPT